MAHCNHENIQVLANAFNCDDGARRVDLKLQCTTCQRLVVFGGALHHMGGRALSIPFTFSGTLMGGEHAKEVRHSV